MTDLELLSHRLQTLENRIRRVKLLAVITCIIIAALALMGQAPSPLPRLGPTIRPVDQLPERVQTRQTVEDEVRARQIFSWTTRAKNALRLSATIQAPYSS